MKFSFFVFYLLFFTFEKWFATVRTPSSWNWFKQFDETSSRELVLELRGNQFIELIFLPGSEAYFLRRSGGKMDIWFSMSIWEMLNRIKSSTFVPLQRNSSKVWAGSPGMLKRYRERFPRCSEVVLFRTVSNCMWSAPYEPVPVELAAQKSLGFSPGKSIWREEECILRGC